ncbi:ATP-binding protein [Streptomyces sp. NPDC048603]|uniref:ATP-binding protein n=1 Tax=Streptomyces sp. NPDC048603 TaxID=3365577 RepID=UPI003710CA75
MNHATEPLIPGLGDGYRMDFTVSEHSARHMRRVLRSFLDLWELPELADAAELALTELIANVVLHVGGRHCAVLILRSPDGVRVEVSDQDPRPARLARTSDDADPLAEGGRGLLLVSAVTDRWGTDRRPGGKTVWFECDGK